MRDRRVGHASARRRRPAFRLPLPALGPALLAATAYMDPGNFAVNIAAGSRFGYRLLWVVLASNLVAMLFQVLSAKLGIASGRNLAELCRERLPQWAVWPIWALSELGAIATDLAELVGGAIGFALLAGVSIFAGLVLTGAITAAVLLLDRAGMRPIEMLVAVFVAVIGGCYLVELWVAPVDWGGAAAGAFLPRLPAGSLPIAVGIVGATVMPHALYLHSGLTQARATPEAAWRRAETLRSNRGIVIALGLAGLVNLAMVAMVAAAFSGGTDIAGIGAAYHTLRPLLGTAAACAFLVALIASGISSAVVGTLAGQIIMQGFLGFRIPVWARRLVTMAPAVVVVGVGLDTTTALVASQIVLSLALPVPMMALVWFTSRRDIMGRCVNGRFTTLAALCAAVVVLAFNIVLVAQLL
ncbi:MAG TPA: Nramp family divalent metal transporter [Stellaceae bacterium]|nr:Nramp family divalent metal transporter [Stellaceae bacterium]